MPQVAAKKETGNNLLSILKSQKKISREQEEEIVRKARKRSSDFYQVILKEKIVPEEELVKSLAVLFGLSRINLSNKSIKKEALDLISEEKARKFKALPFEKKGKLIKVAITNPYQLPEFDDEVVSNWPKEGRRVRFYLTTQNDLKSALNQYNKGKDKTEEKPLEVENKEESSANNQSESTNINDELLKYLVNQDKVDSSRARKWQEIAQDKNLDLVDFLLEKDLKESDIRRAQAQKHNLSFVRIKEDKLSKDVISRIPKDLSEKYSIAAFDQIGERVLKVATTNPNSKALQEIIDFAQTKKGVDVRLFLVTSQDLEKIISHYPDQAEQKKAAKEKDEEAKEPEAKNLQEEEKPTRPEESSVKAQDGGKKKEGAEKQESSPEDNQIELKPKDSIELKSRIGSLIKKKVDNNEQLEEIIEEASAPRIVAGLINFALSKRASDVHIQPTDNATRLRFRVDGVLDDITDIPSKLHPAIVSRIKILSKLRIDERRIPQDGRFEVEFEDRAVDLRVSTLPTSHGNEKVVLRLLDKSKKIFKLNELGLRGSGYRRLEESIKKPYGMIIATGPTGSGKSTTLYASLSEINSPKVNIITLEDPVEYEIDGISQSQARPDIGFSFANGLRSVLRQDPDVIMVGEIRDKETAQMAVHAALTGHLMFSTLHTNDAAGAVPRLIDMGVEPFLISSSANIFIAQRLVRKVCPHCKKEDPKFNNKTKDKIKNILKELPESEKKAVPKEDDWKLYKGEGCDKCYQGYKGRIGIFEVMPLSEEIKKMINKDVSASDLKKKAVREGMVTMQQDGVVKALKGETTLEEVFRVTVVKEEQF